MSIDFKNTYFSDQVSPEKSLGEPRSTRKVDPDPRSLNPHLKWWLQEANVLQGQLIHKLYHVLQIFTNVSIKGWGAN